MANSYEKSLLWRSAFAPKSDGHDAGRSRLEAEYAKFWERSQALVQRINQDFPDLTLHDGAHLAALWDRASQLAGENYPINPLEAFVLGGAILLHDAGHAIASYKDGLETIEKTIEFKDALAGLHRRELTNPTQGRRDAESDLLVKRARLIAVRRLHAARAENLASEKVNDLYLIDDSEIRNTLGRLIGKIAASHHWDLIRVEQELPHVQGAPGFLPRDWSIQPIKIACLLRCADAVQVDQTRATAVAFSLQQPTGTSKQHWVAQQLAQPVVGKTSDSGGRSLIFTSQSDFEEEAAEAWWLAYDLLQNAHKELQACSQLMRSLDLPSFTVDRIAGCESPSQMARYVRPRGWRPIASELKVTDVDHVISLFGGSLLYGNDKHVPLRELIQNASDAVRARRAMEADSFYRGRVCISLQANDGGGYILSVEDDGIGMSEHTLSTTLTDFGRSFWLSEEMHDEFPGLASTDFEHAGRYGVGFFSVFMITDKVEVVSRKLGASSDDVRTLRIKKEKKLRPLVLKTGADPLRSSSTIVRLHLDDATKEALLSAMDDHRERIELTLEQLVQLLCPCIDCDIYTSELIETPKLAHRAQWYEQDAIEWLREILAANALNDERLNARIAHHAPRLEVIRGSSGQIVGRAAIACALDAEGMISVAGLATTGRSHRLSSLGSSFVGALTALPSGPARNFGPYPDPTALKRWASLQGADISRSDANSWEKYLAAIHMAWFGGDVSPLAMIMLNGEIASLETVIDKLIELGELHAPIAFKAERQIGQVLYLVNPHYARGVSHDDMDLTSAVLEAWESHASGNNLYHRIPSLDESESNCFLVALRQAAADRGVDIRFDILDDFAFGSYTGPSYPREGLVTGHLVRGKALKIRVIRGD